MFDLHLVKSIYHHELYERFSLICIPLTGEGKTPEEEDLLNIPVIYNK